MNVINNMLVMLSHGIPGLVVAGMAMISILLGLIRREEGLVYFAAFLFIPFAYTLGSWTGLHLFVRLMPLFLVGSGVALSNNETLIAWLAPLPPAAYLVYILFNIISSDL